MKATHKTTLNSFWHNLCSACGSLACNRRSSNCGSCFKRSTKKKIQNPDVRTRKSHACQKRSDHAGSNNAPAKKARDLQSCRSARPLRLILWSTTTWAAPPFAMFEGWAPADDAIKRLRTTSPWAAPRFVIFEGPQSEIPAQLGFDHAAGVRNEISVQPSFTRTNMGQFSMFCPKLQYKEQRKRLSHPSLGTTMRLGTHNLGARHPSGVVPPTASV